MGYTSGPRSVTVWLRYSLLLATVVGTGLRFLKLGHQSLWADEMLTVRNAFIGKQISMSDIIHNLQGPAISLGMHFWGAVGSSDAFLRVPFAIAGCLTVVAVYLLARSVMDSWAALHSVFLASISPILIWYSQEIRGYSFVILFMVMMTYFFVKWVIRPTARTLMVYGIFLFLGLVSNLSAGFVAVSHLFYLVLSPGRRKLVGKWVVAVFIVLLVFSPWVREIMVRVHPEKLVTGEEGDTLRGGAQLSSVSLPYAFFTYSVGYSLGPSVRELQTRRAESVSENLHWIALAGAVFAIPIVVGIAGMARRNPSLLFFLLVWLGVPVAAVSALVLRNIKVFTPRYALVSIPAYLLLVGYGLAGITRTRYWPFVVLFAAVMAVSIVNYFSSPVYAKDDFKREAEIIRQGYMPGDVVVGVFSAQPLRHYLKGIAGVEFFSADDLASEESKAARCTRLAQDAERVWLSLCRDWFVDPQGSIKKWFDTHMSVVESHTFPGVDLHLYQRRSD